LGLGFFYGLRIGLGQGFFIIIQEQGEISARQDAPDMSQFGSLFGNMEPSFIALQKLKLMFAKLAEFAGNARAFKPEPIFLAGKSDFITTAMAAFGFQDGFERFKRYIPLWLGAISRFLA
jgi:hypothetical protein